MNELVKEDSKTISVSEVTANVVGAYMEQNPDMTMSMTISNKELVVNVTPNMKKSEIEIKPGKSENSITVSVSIPGELETPTTFKVPVFFNADQSSVNIKQLEYDISNGFMKILTSQIQS